MYQLRISVKLNFVKQNPSWVNAESFHEWEIIDLSNHTNSIKGYVEIKQAQSIWKWEMDEIRLFIRQPYNGIYLSQLWSWRTNAKVNLLSHDISYNLICSGYFA